MSLPRVVMWGIIQDSTVLFPKHYYLRITASLIILFSLSSASNENYYWACTHQNYSCGSIQVGYPFNGMGRPDFCGFPEFHLPCTGSTAKQPQIDLSPLDPNAKVVSINTSLHKMTVSIDRVHFCQPDWISSSSITTPDLNKLHLPPPFKFSLTVVNITVFYSCNESVSKYGAISMCPWENGTSVGGSDSAVYLSKMPDVIPEDVKSCKNLSVPVLKRLLDKLRMNSSDASLRDMVHEVELEYIAPNFNECSECTKSGGTCGSDNGSGSLQFMCHCPHGHLHHSHTQCKSGSRKKISIVILALSTISALAILILVAKLAVLIRSRKIHSLNKFTFSWSRGTEKDNQNVEAFLKSYGSLAPKQFTYKDIKKMTNSFKDRLGEGGYGHVYKGKLPHGRLVAVKVLKKLKGNNGQDFINEVVSISRTNHVNVVTLLGFCFEGNKQALVYEFLPNGSLEKFIHGSGHGNAPLSSETLFNIVVGIAKGLDYLHGGCNTRILHLDIKPHNILLDENFCPKICDFGLARLFPKEQSHISTNEARGTIGYIAPEVFSRSFGGISHKSDVYSFGMMVIDLVCGRMNNASDQVQCSGDLNFTQWIYKQLEAQEKIGLEEGINAGEEGEKLRKKMILVSLWCIQTYPTNRPSMNEVVEMLEDSLESLEMPPNEEVCWPSLPTIDSSGTS